MRLPFCLLVLATACTPTDRSEDEEPLPPCETDVAGALAGLRVPGVSAGIIANGEVVCTSVAGMADIEADRPVTQDTVFAWASVSKTMTATAALVLYDEGRFGLDDDIDGYLPFSPRNPNCAQDPITFRQLLTHTSSIIDNDEIYDASYTIGDSPTPLGEFVRGYVEPGGEFYDAGENFARKCPGNVNSYSNVAVGLLGHLVEEISGMAFDDFCRERIFVPLGMTDTSFHLGKLDLEKVAMPYEGRAPDPWIAHGHVGFPTFPDGLLRTSVPHMARFLAMNAGLGEFQGTRILSESTSQEIRRLQIPDLDDTQGLIWYYEFDGTVIGHDGEDPGTSSTMFFDPDDGRGALIVANGDWNHANGDVPEADALFEALMEEARR